jgi:hypothetical protein
MGVKLYPRHGCDVGGRRHHRRVLRLGLAALVALRAPAEVGVAAVCTWQRARARRGRVRPSAPAAAAAVEAARRQTRGQGHNGAANRCPHYRPNISICPCGAQQINTYTPVARPPDDILNSSNENAAKVEISSHRVPAAPGSGQIQSPGCAWEGMPATGPSCGPTTVASSGLGLPHLLHSVRRMKLMLPQSPACAETKAEMRASKVHRQT